MDVRNIELTTNNTATSQSKADSLSAARDEALDKQDNNFFMHFKVVDTKEGYFDTREQESHNQVSAKRKKKSKSKNSFCSCFSRNKGNKD